ncbi:uncharacterized protein LOC128717763 [Anopheles marshallii]|uniref:uncharacterized protein LOC128717763 n=1 Tax=Anopheles marshallii TaxID=1521116 RepID=UPI00237AF581|nr:uncharacterized protein LOC128717763 [Anopheles marshallii]
MDEFRTGYLVALLALVSLGQIVVAQTEEYEYYYEEVNVTSTTLPLSVPPIETTTVTLVVAAQGTAATTTPLALVVENSEEPKNITALPIVDDTTDGILVQNNWSTTAIDSKPLDPVYAHRTDQILTQLNSTRPVRYNFTVYKTTTRPNTQPGIVLNIYTGMYGMHSRGKYQPSGGQNNFRPRTQPTLQGWYGMYGMYNRRPMQSYMPRQNAPPVYRGRGPQNGYNGGYNSFTYHTATKPRRNVQQTHGPALDQQASLAVFNFLLQALGQRSGANGRSKSQVQQGSRRRQ